MYSRVLSLFPEPWIELFVRLYIYILAAIYVLKEVLFEAGNQGIEKRLRSEIEQSPLIRSHRPKLAIVTGADGTIGRQVVRLLLSYNFTVHAMVGDIEKAKLCFRDDLTSSKRQPRQLKLFEVQLEDPYAVIEYGESFSPDGDKIDVVVLCAGTMLANEKYLDGVESHLCVNLVSQALLLDYVKPLLGIGSRMVMLGSCCSRAAYLHGKYSSDQALSQYIGPYQAYAMSKISLAAYVKELAQRDHLPIASLHPGVIPGTLYRNLNIVSRLVTYLVLPKFLRTPRFSALLVLHTLLRKDFCAGAYYEDCVPRNVPDRLGQNERAAIFRAVRGQIDAWKSDEE